jgi:hypothetical protein
MSVWVNDARRDGVDDSTGVAEEGATNVGPTSITNVSNNTTHFSNPPFLLNDLMDGLDMGFFSFHLG